MTFDASLAGHRPIRERLLARLEAGRLPGSMLFTGPDGIGKRRVLLELAKRELCFRRTVCGECEGCRAFDRDPLPVELPNFLRIAPEGKAGVIKIGVIRDSDLVEGGVISWAHNAPPPRCHRWILVEDAHRLNGPSANILLKTLEEPPPGTHFALVTHRPEAVLQTIRSRCERIAFAPLEEAEAWAVALKAGWSEADRARWTALSAGSLRLLDPADFGRAVEQLEAWLDLMEGGIFADCASSLLPDKDSALAQSEQLRQPLELLLGLLADLERIRGGSLPRALPWQSRLAPLAASALDPRTAQNLVYLALRHLVRNPMAEPLLRELAMALRPERTRTRA
jgi:DNA polymerase-3 subunit delta'